MQAADAESDESDDDMNWEDMDLDAVKLPGAKKAELAAPEAPKRAAKDDEVSCMPGLTQLLAMERARKSTLAALRCRVA